MIVERQKVIASQIDDLFIEAGFRADLVVEDRLLIELKSIDRLAPVHTKQVVTYLRFLKLPVGLLMNFGGETFKEGLRRIVNNHID
jgi:GxxExxY protein